MTVAEKHSANLRDIIYTTGVPSVGDPAEDYFEASKLTREGLPWETPGVPILLNSKELQVMSQRAARRYASRPFLPLGEAPPVPGEMHQVMRSRRSVRKFSGNELLLGNLNCMLYHSYGSYEWGHQKRRNLPSGGALYPLDLFVVSRHVEKLEHGAVYHFDPYRHGLAHMHSMVDFEALGKAVLLPEVAANASAFIIISGSFWRSRFKYGQRALRFVLQESGHACQNLLLTATALGMDSCTFGGFVDEEILHLLPDHNGVDDAPLYVIMLSPQA